MEAQNMGAVVLDHVQFHAIQYGSVQDSQLHGPPGTSHVSV